MSNKDNGLKEDERIEERKQCKYGKESDADSFGAQIVKCLYKNNLCNCPTGSCVCPAGSCVCPAGSCTCPEGSCTCPEGTCPQTSELIQNPSFEIPCAPPPPCAVFSFWSGTNIASSSNALTGIAAAEIGASNPNPATLEQTVCGIHPNCPYEFSFSVNTQNQSNNAQFTAQVFWQDGFAPVEAFTPIVRNGSTSGNNYVFIKRITSLAPAGTTCARIVFTKIGTGSVLVDDVSFSG